MVSSSCLDSGSRGEEAGVSSLISMQARESFHLPFYDRLFSFLSRITIFHVSHCSGSSFLRPGVGVRVCSSLSTKHYL